MTQNSRDYTDDSYTDVTESEFSFDSDVRPRRRHSHGSRNNTSQRQIDKIAELSEEGLFYFVQQLSYLFLFILK